MTSRARVRDLARVAWACPLLWLSRWIMDQDGFHHELARWAELREIPANSHADLVSKLLWGFPEYRNVLFFRLKDSNQFVSMMAKVARRIWRPLPSLDIACNDIAPGLVISHGLGTILAAKKIGQNCWVHHEVTIGWTYGGGQPTIGDGVFIGAGAKVLGGISIGDGARIGANAVVLRDVPPGATAVGVPAEIKWAAGASP